MVVDWIEDYVVVDQLFQSFSVPVQTFAPAETMNSFFYLISVFHLRIFAV